MWISCALWKISSKALILFIFNLFFSERTIFGWWWLNKMPFIIFEYVWGDGGEGMENNEFRLKMTNVIFFNLIFREVVKRTLTFFKVREGGQLLCQSSPRQKNGKNKSFSIPKNRIFGFKNGFLGQILTPRKLSLEILFWQKEFLLKNKKTAGSAELWKMSIFFVF